MKYERNSMFKIFSILTLLFAHTVQADNSCSQRVLLDPGMYRNINNSHDNCTIEVTESRFVAHKITVLESEWAMICFEPNVCSKSDSQTIKMKVVNSTSFILDDTLTSDAFVKCH